MFCMSWSIQSILKYMLSYISMIHLCLFFLIPLSFSCSNREHLNSMLTYWILHEEFDWSETWNLSYVLFVSDFFPSEPLLLACLILNTWQPMLYSLFLHVLCWHSFWKTITTYCWKYTTSLFPRNIKNIFSREVVVPTQTFFPWRYPLSCLFTHYPCHW